MSSTSATEQTNAPTLKRDFTFGSAFAFAFAFISPIVALYGIYGLAASTAGLSFWWGFLIVFGGQFLVALVFAMLVSRWPLEGSIYQWTAGIFGPRVGWFAGWFYIWTLVIAMATVALGAAGFIANLIGISEPTGTQKAWIAFIVLLIGTGINLAGRGLLKWFMYASIGAEIIGSIGLGIWLLVSYRVQDFSVLFDGGASVGASEGFFSLGGVFLIAMVFIGFSFVGFESAGSIAEEVREPRKNLPRAVLFSITFIAAVVMFSSLAIILATPDDPSSLPGYDIDPVYAVLTAQLGEGIAKPIQLLFAIGFIASFLALQTSASRLIWATARDGAMPFAKQLSRLSKAQKQPVVPIVITTVIGTALFLLSNVAADLYILMVNFTSGGFYLSFLFPVAAFTIAVLSGKWKSGPFSLGKATGLVAVIALLWVIFELLNIAWPRPAFDNPWLDWSVILGAAGLTVIGFLIYLRLRNNIVAADTAVARMIAEESSEATSQSS